MLATGHVVILSYLTHTSSPVVSFSLSCGACVLTLQDDSKHAAALAALDRTRAQVARAEATSASLEREITALKE